MDAPERVCIAVCAVPLWTDADNFRYVSLAPDRLPRGVPSPGHPPPLLEELQPTAQAPAATAHRANEGRMRRAGESHSACRRRRTASIHPAVMSQLIVEIHVPLEPSTGGGRRSRTLLSEARKRSSYVVRSPLARELTGPALAPTGRAPAPGR